VDVCCATSGIPVGTVVVCLSIQPSNAKLYRKCTTHIVIHQ
jgi:hypothetical protein